MGYADFKPPCLTQIFFSSLRKALIARDIPLDTPKKRAATAHVIMRGLQLGVLVSAALAAATVYNQQGVLQGMTASPEVRNWASQSLCAFFSPAPRQPRSHVCVVPRAQVRAAAAAVMPMVLATQVLKGMSYSTGGILLG